ncbi:MAG: alpha-rhamnosidase [Pedobacter sp.]|uniref:alpha-L-rhamnosidase-related protein n=1 Tax=Pedobacter sp. TaxID=1411316 RepID=UPI003390F196
MILKYRNSLVLIVFFLSLCTESTLAQKATWIWYPGDFEIWLGNRMQNRRTERGSFLPPFWKMDSHYVLIDFHKDFELSEAEVAELYVEGQYNVKIDGKSLFGYPDKISIPAGKHRISLKVFCQNNVPAIFVRGKKVISDSSWLVTFEDKEWIDQSGKASDQSGTSWLNAAAWNFDSPSSPPSAFKLAVKPQAAVKTERSGQSLMVDFGKETFGFLKLQGLKGKGTLGIYYGESREEALDTARCETLDKLHIGFDKKKDTIHTLTRAFRYVNIQMDPGMSLDSVSMLYEYLPVEDKGNFRCSDEEINRIYEVSKYTFHLNTREFFIDGIKRDRWIWSGDAYQSYLMNYYLLFDSASVTRTLLALRGKDPVTSHVNTIMDYTFYWFMGIHDYYEYTGDKTFIRQFYPRMKSLMDYCLARRNKDGMMEGMAGDWVFIDWADGLSKQGELSFEQLLLARSLETMATSAAIANDKVNAAHYNLLASELKKNIFGKYWNTDKQALVHSYVNGQQTNNVTRYANMFGIFFNYFNDTQKLAVKKHVLLNPSVQKITTPYMRFYELEALCAMGEQPYVLKEIKDYWGGMLKLGATSFWEEFDPGKKGTEHLAMYGRPFGKSLCHAWGASPIYLLGKYFLGVKPTSPGYGTYLAEPELAGLDWMEGTVPTPHGSVKLYCSKTEIRISGTEGTGTLRIKSKTKPLCKGAKIKALENHVFEIQIIRGGTHTIQYNL